MLPLMLIAVPPASGPLAGLTPATVGTRGGGGGASPPDVEALTVSVLAEVAELVPTVLEAVTTTFIRWPTSEEVRR